MPNPEEFGTLGTTKPALASAKWTVALYHCIIIRYRTHICEVSSVSWNSNIVGALPRLWRPCQREVFSLAGKMHASEQLPVG